MLRTPSAAFRMVVLATTLIALAGCATPGASPAGTALGGAPASGVPGVTVPPATAGTPTAAPGATVGGFTGDACDLLTDADVLELTGYPVASKGPTPLAYTSTCLWTLDGVAWDISLGVDPTGGVSGYDRLVEFQGGGEPIPDLGDRAIRLEDSNNPIAQLGSGLYDLLFTGLGEPDGLDVALLKRVVENAART